MSGKVLQFEDPLLESHFAAYFGWRCRRPTFLLSAVFTTIWIVRWAGAQWRTELPYMTLISGLFIAMATMHLANTVHIYRDPSVCRDEIKKAKYLGIDAIACMVTVLLYGGKKEVAEQSFYPARLISTPFMIYGIHGWAVVFGGFRLSADFYLHFLNLQIYLFTKIQTGYLEIWPNVPSAFAAFCTFTILPCLVNVFYEANERSIFLRQQNIPQARLGSLWVAVLKTGLASQTGPAETSLAFG